jgi:ferredoxin-NADP reductase
MRKPGSAGLSHRSARLILCMHMQTTTLISQREVAHGTREFEFEKPEGFTYAAGQTIDITLIDPPYTDTEGSTRTFSLSSAPHEPTLKIVTRMRESAFKRSLGGMQPGTPVSFTGPFGSFSLHENQARPAVFIAGGIGITPFRSIVLAAQHEGLPHRTALIYSNRRPEDAAFLDELAEVPSLTLIPTMTSDAAEGWEGERGHITPELIRKAVPPDTNPIYYIAGPLMMVTSLRQTLKEMGISGDDIRFEDFAGYE